MKNIHICLATDETYAPYCGVVIASAMKHKAADEILHFYILYQNLSEMSKNSFKSLLSESCNINLLDTRGDERIIALNDMPLPKGAHTTVETYFRIFIADIFSDLDKVLYLDCDILVKGSLAGLFETDMQGKLIAMAKADGYVGKCWNHYNAGVVLIDCKTWRDENITEYLFKFTEEAGEEIGHDEDLMNFAMNDRICQIDYQWNRQIILDHSNGCYYDQNDKILHFISPIKPWHGIYQDKIVDEYFEYLYKLPWDVKDNRGRNISIDSHKYYQYRMSLKCLIADGLIEQATGLVVLETSKALPELEYAAMDLSFLNVSRKKLDEISEKREKNTYFLLDGFYDAEVKKALDQKGYCIGKDYSFVRLLENNEIEQKILKNISQKRIKGIRGAVYGTGEWAQKCTEVLVRNGADILFYIDSNREKDGQFFCGKEIISPSKLAEQDKEVKMFFLASSYYHEMRETLLALDIQEETIIEFDFMGK